MSEREDTFSTAFEFAPIGMALVAPDGRWLKTNRALCDLIGYTEAELLTRTFQSLTHPDDIEISEENVRRLVTGEVLSFLLEKRYIHKRGHFITSLTSVSLVRDGQGQPRYLIAQLQDITKRKAADLALLRSQNRLRDIIDGMGPSMFVGLLTTKGILIEVNQSPLTAIGVTAEEVLGKPFDETPWWTHTPEAQQQLRNAITRAASGESSRYDVRLRGAENEPIDLDFSLQPLRDESGEVVFLVPSASVITERKQAEADRTRLLSELESEQARLQDIFTHAPAFIAFLRGPDHIFELANSRYYDLVGPRDLIGTKVRDAFPELEGQGFFELLDSVYTSGFPFAGNEMPVELVGKANHPLELRYITFVYQPLRDVEGSVSGIICHGVDVTEQVLSRRRLKESDNQLRQSQKLESVGLLAGGIAHDFNSLLTVIMGYSELTRERLDKSDPLDQYLEGIEKAAERAASLTRQLLTFSRKQMLEPKVLDLNFIIAEILRMLARLVGEDMELCSAPTIGLGLVKADPGQIEQVIINLVVNARDAMPEGGKITIETANVFLDEEYTRSHFAVQQGWYVMLAVSDTGHGMDSETLKSIFEPFFTTKEQGKGTGLGLSTVYGIVKQSGGNIWVYSEVGLGTSFKIYLPLVDELVSERDSSPARLESLAGTETILLAEDDEIVRNLTCEGLIMNGYTVLRAANAEEALLISQQHVGPIHLLLTDVVMPRMSGRELAEHLVRQRPGTPVLYMSGYPDRAIVRKGIVDGDNAFISKPFTPEAMALKVKEVLHQMVVPGSAV